MSMTATVVQVEEAEISRFRADPSLVEMLFENGPLVPPAFTALAKTMQDRVRAAGPQAMAYKLAQLDPRLRQQLEASMGRIASAGGGDAILKLMEQRTARSSGPTASAATRAVL